MKLPTELPPSGTYDGTIDDKWFKYLRSTGLTGALSDMLANFVESTLTFGNDIITGTPTATVAPDSRRMAFIGDSRVEGSSSGQFAGEVANAVGEWCWVRHDQMNYGSGGSTIYHAVNTQAPSAVADGNKVFVVLTGTNGARTTGEGDEVDTLATRKAETQNLMSVLDVAGATIFLCNEMPGQNGGGGTPQIKVDHHLWLKDLTAATAGPGDTALANADLVIVNTWDAVCDGSETTSTVLTTQWANDGLHPATQGQERMAKAVWDKMNAHWTGPWFDPTTTPDQRLWDGTTTVSVNRGTLPSGWADFGAAGDLTYTTTGTGADTETAFTNSGASMLAADCRRSPATLTDAVLFVEYVITEDSSGAGGSTRDYSPRVTLEDYVYGASETVWPVDSSSTKQPQEMGGVRRMAVYLGTEAAGDRFRLRFTIRGGQTVTVKRFDIFER